MSWCSTCLETYMILCVDLWLFVCLFVVFFPSSFLEVKACDQQQWQWKYITAFIGLVIAFCVAVQGREVTWVCATSGVNKLYKDTYSAPLSPLREEYVRWINNGKWGTLYYETPVGRCWENEKWPFYSPSCVPDLWLLIICTWVPHVVRSPALVSVFSRLFICTDTWRSRRVLGQSA